MFQRILLAYDGSEWAKRAALLAGEITRKEKESELWIVCAMGNVASTVGEALAEQWISHQTIEGGKLLDEAEELVGSHVPIHRELMFRPPAESIIEVADTRGIDLIIIGSRGSGALAGLLVGSQSQKVISLAKCPVMVIK